MKSKKSLILLALAGIVFGLSASLAKNNVSSEVMATLSPSQPVNPGEPTPGPTPEPDPRPDYPVIITYSYEISDLSLMQERDFYEGDLIGLSDFKCILHTIASNGTETTTEYNPLGENFCLNSGGGVSGASTYCSNNKVQLAKGDNVLKISYKNSGTYGMCSTTITIKAEEKTFNKKKLVRIESLDEINENDIYYIGSCYDSGYYFLSNSLRYDYSKDKFAKLSSPTPLYIGTENILKSNASPIDSVEANENLSLGKIKFAQLEASDGSIKCRPYFADAQVYSNDFSEKYADSITENVFLRQDDVWYQKNYAYSTFSEDSYWPFSIFSFDEDNMFLEMERSYPSNPNYVLYNYFDYSSLDSCGAIWGDTTQRPTPNIILYKEVLITAEDVAEEFNNNIDLYCNEGINPVLTGENSVSSTWATAAEQYSQLGDEEKEKFIDSSIEEILTMLSKYGYIYGKYGSTIGEDFLGRFSNYDPAAQGNKYKIFNIKDINNSTWIIAVVSLIGLTSVGAYFFYRKRKEE